MKQGVVKVLRVQGANKRTFVANEKVNDTMFPDGVFDVLVKEGKIAEGEFESKSTKAGKKNKAEE